MKYKSLATILLIFLFTSFTYTPNAKTDILVTIITEMGEIKVILFDDTPIHKGNFIKNVESGVYEGSNFHRIINNFMIQGGEPKITIFPDSADFNERTIPNEISTKHQHDYGALAAARTENPEKRSDKTQFFIVQNRNGAHYLDNAYTVFGKVVAGMDIVEKIAVVPVNGSAPIKPVIFSIKIEEVKRTDMVKFYGNIYNF